MIPINFDSLISAITGIVSPSAFIKDKLQRNETVIKLLQQFNLNPDHPPADFSGVYAYALVEYGVGKPKPMLQLFRQKEIQQAFRQALEQNNPAILLKEGESYITGYALGDEIRALGIDPKREFYEFAAVFIEVAKRTRTPAEVLTNQRLESLHKRIATIQEVMDRLPTLEGIRTEMARLAAQNYPALPPADLGAGKPRPETSGAFALAQQMRGWFETLGYRLEKYEVWENTYFEWIINIPVRRNRYDRILIRGIEGEAGLRDVAALRESVARQRTDEGWLVTARRISRAARDEVENQENSHLSCYTFDELLDEDADFSNYLDWLEAEVKRRRIDKNYVPLACTKEEIDLVSKRRLGISRYDERDGWIEGYINLWIDDPVKEHISILGEFGTGKTWFALHFAWMALQSYRDAKKRGLERPRLPLVIPLRDYAKAVSVESLFSEFFFRKHEIPLPGYSAFEQLNRMGKLLLIFDGFDEMAARVDRQQMINNFWELAKVVVPGAKVILTCRTEHFPEAKEGRALLNAELQASTANLTGETPQFEVLELEKFNDEQIRQVLSLQADYTTVEQVMGNPQLLDLARRPVMTDLILEALPDIQAGKPVDMSRIYLYAVRRKMERDIKAERTFTSLADKLYFLCELSWEMLSTDQLSLNYRLFPDRIRRLFGGVVQEEKDLDHWHYDMMGQTMLIRNADGDYTPAHKSLLEFFVAYKFAAELGVLAGDFTELVQPPEGCVDTSRGERPFAPTWSGYCQLQVQKRQQNALIPPIKGFVSESLERLRDGFGRAPLTKAVMDLLVPMLATDVATDASLTDETDVAADASLTDVTDKLSVSSTNNLSASSVAKSVAKAVAAILDATRGKTAEEVGYVGGNAATLLVKVDKGALEGRDLSGAVIRGADFSNASLRGVNFAGADLGECVFANVFGAVFTVAFSSDGKLFATGDAKCEITVWQFADAQPISQCKGHSDWVRSVAFSPDGKTLASGSFDSTVRCWDIYTGECLKTFEGHTKRVHSVFISPDGNILASASSDRTVKLWNIKTGECLKTLQGHTKAIRSVVISPDSKTVVSSGSDKTIRCWDIETGECLLILQGHTDWARSLAFSPDGKTLASASVDKTVRCWNIETGECLLSLSGHTERVRSVAINADGVTLASASYDRTIKLWNIKTGECLKTLQGHTDWVRSVAFSPDGTTLLSSSDDKTVRCWDIYTGECRKTLQGYFNGVRIVAISPDGTTLVSGSEDSTVCCWDIESGECLLTLQGHTSRVNTIAISPDSTILATGGYDETAKLWNLRTGKYLKTLQHSSSCVNSLAFSPDGKILACGSANRMIKLWDINTGECMNTLEGHTDWIWSVVFSPDGLKIASASVDKTVRCWDAHTGECLKILHGHTKGVNLIEFSPDSITIASASDDQTVKLWDIRTGECFNTLQGHINLVNSVAFSPDGTKIVSASDDLTVKLWDIQTGECLMTLLAHTYGVRSVVFHPDGKTIASGSWDGTIKLWDINTGHCLKTLRHPRPYEHLNITNATGLTPTEKSTLKALGAIDNGE